MDFMGLLRSAVDYDASDLHIQAGSAPMMRVGGNIRAVETPPVSDDDVRGLIASMLPRFDRDGLSAALAEGIDFSFALETGERFRCSAYRQLGSAGITLRIVRQQISTIEELHLPKTLNDIALSRRGLTLVTGTTGSGKSTTLSSMIDLINHTHRTKIITIEDPIEQVFVADKAFVSQFEVGSDTPSFGQAMRQALRQDPDVIFVGELRDVETLRMALRAADTGHQVFSTVHSSNAPQTVERIIAMFPPDEHKLLLSQLAGSIEAIVSQRLVKLQEGGRRPAVEIMRGTAVTEKFIEELRLDEIHAYMETGESGMQTFDQHLLEMFDSGMIRMTEALRAASNPEALSRHMGGIRRS